MSENSLHKVYPRVTRVEVIDATGRAFVRYYEPLGVTVQAQDEGQTLKVFAGGELTTEHPAKGKGGEWAAVCSRADMKGWA